MSNDCENCERAARLLEQIAALARGAYGTGDEAQALAQIEDLANVEYTCHAHELPCDENGDCAMCKGARPTGADPNARDYDFAGDET